MRKYFKLSLSSFLTMLIIVSLAVILTANIRTAEKTNLGKNVVSSQGANIYLKDADISFRLPANCDRFFRDTKNNFIANYMEEMGTLFVAELYNEPYDMEVRVGLLEVSELPEDMLSYDMENSYGQEKEVLRQMIRDNCPQASEYQDAGRIGVDHQYFLHSYYSYKEDAYYNLVSQYVTLVNGKSVDIRFVTYDSKPLDINSDLKLLDSKFLETRDSIRFGDTIENLEKEKSGFWKTVVSFSFYLGIFLIPLFYFLLGNMTVVTNPANWQEDALGRKHSKEILGFFAVCIVLHHLVQQIGAENAGGLTWLEDMGVCFVGVYFFYSGYGLIQSYLTKKDYLRGFFRKRLPAVLVPFYVCIFLFVLQEVCCGASYGVKDYIAYLSGVWLINGHMWYIVEIFFLYLFFWFFFRICRKETYAYIGMVSVCIFMVLQSLILGHGDKWFQGEWWYNTTLLFPLGMLFARFEKRILIFVRKYYKAAIVLVSASYIALMKATLFMLEHYGYWTEYNGRIGMEGYLDKLKTLSVQLPMVICFAALILLIGQKVKCSNAALKFLGEISLELYLIHNLFLRGFAKISGQGVYFTAVLVCSIVFAALLHKFDQMIICKLQGKKLPKAKSKLPAAYQYMKTQRKAAHRLIHFCMRHPARALRRVYREIICLIFVFLSIYPIWTLAVNATQKGMILKTMLLPGKSFLDNLNTVNSIFEGTGGSLYQGMLSSCVIAIPTALLTTYLAALTAYAFSRYDFCGKKIFWWGIIACMLMPSFASFAGLYRILVKAHLLNHYLPVILMGIANPAAVYFIRLYLQNLNLQEIGEAARIDGAGEFRIFNQIILPIIRPVLALQITFSFVNAWNNGFTQTLLLMDWSKKPITAYVKIIAGDNGSAMNPLAYALAFACTIVPFIVYILCSKSIVSSITLGAIKE